MIKRGLKKLQRALNLWRLRSHPDARVVVGHGVMLYGFPLLALKAGSTLQVGDGVVLCSDSAYTALALNHPLKIATHCASAVITIGAHTGISGGALVAAERIDIGREVLLGANVTIVDTDFHPVAATGRRHSDDPSRIATAPVWIGDNVFIGTGAVILKGVRIGRDSVVGAGSVVHGEFPERSIIAGNPARVIGQVPD
jgi:acetyltransferase-like isoleucine patch superfamily enzyme